MDNDIKKQRPLVREIVENVEYLSTSYDDTIACISVEELCGILRRQGLLTEAEARHIEQLI